MKRKIQTCFRLSAQEQKAVQDQALRAAFWDTLPEAFAQLQAKHAALQKEFDTLRTEHEALKQAFYEQKQIANVQPAQQAKCPVGGNIQYIGEIIRFGNYDWYVIAINGNLITLLCKKIINHSAYNVQEKKAAWVNCSLRKWLNEVFYNTFSDNEKEKIVKTQCTNNGNNEFGTTGIKDTEDYVYLLSISEARALTPQIRVSGDGWWLRSSGGTQNTAASVRINGDVNTYGYNVNTKNGVRPVITVRI